jgi:hypothetical protein
LAIEQTLVDVARLPRKALGQGRGSPLISVIIPNYNHRAFLDERLTSVANQTLRDIEIIVLDDASTDDSKAILEKFVANDPRARLFCNSVNSGSTFKQWRKGLAMAQGKYIWIAESDDAADRRFLELTAARLEADASLTIAHAQSMMIDTQSVELGRPDQWLDELAPGRWRRDFTIDGLTEIRDFLSQKNTIPNASAVLFRNFPGIELLVDDTMRLCADWLFWIRLLARGGYAFVSTELNCWRQQSSNARTRIPGVLEWQEGQRILIHAADILGLTSVDRDRMIDAFHRRCMEWSDGRLE